MCSRGRSARGPPEAADPQQDDVASQMASLAHSFVTGSAAEGHHFHYAVDDGPRLDELVELFQMSAPSDDVVHSMVLSMGAYVEEVLVRNASGQWRVEMQAPAIRLPGDLDCFPLNKVAKRITVGPEHSIGQFIDVAMAGEVPPDARRWHADPL